VREGHVVPWEKSSTKPSSKSNHEVTDLSLAIKTKGQTAWRKGIICKYIFYVQREFPWRSMSGNDRPYKPNIIFHNSKKVMRQVMEAGL